MMSEGKQELEARLLLVDCRKVAHDVLKIVAYDDDMPIEVRGEHREAFAQAFYEFIRQRESELQRELLTMADAWKRQESWKDSGNCASDLREQLESMFPGKLSSNPVQPTAPQLIRALRTQCASCGRESVGEPGTICSMLNANNERCLGKMHKQNCPVLLDDESDYEHLDDAGTCTCAAAPEGSTRQAHEYVPTTLDELPGLDDETESLDRHSLVRDSFGPVGCSCGKWDAILLDRADEIEAAWQAHVAASTRQDADGK